jgi:probable F420-dependent oxidoreductase
MHKFGSLGVWQGTDDMTAAEAASFAGRVESLGFSALWVAEGYGRNVLVHSAWLLANTQKLLIGSGIANIYARDHTAMDAAQQTLSEQSNGRFILGMGVSHAPAVKDRRGHEYEKPVAKMRQYLTELGTTTYQAPKALRSPRIIAALGPKMINLAAELADGILTYNMTADHSHRARSALGRDKILCVEQMVVLETEPNRARASGREMLKYYVVMENYRNAWKSLGFSDIDFDNNGSDRLIDAVVAWGDVETIWNRIEQHWSAGADHVCIQALGPAGSARYLPEESTLASVASLARARRRE